MAHLERFQAAQAASMHALELLSEGGDAALHAETLTACKARIQEGMAYQGHAYRLDGGCGAEAEMQAFQEAGLALSDEELASRVQKAHKRAGFFVPPPPHTGAIVEPSPCRSTPRISPP